MSYLDTLEEIKGIVERTEEFNYAQRILLLDILGEKSKWKICQMINLWPTMKMLQSLS